MALLWLFATGAVAEPSPPDLAKRLDRQVSALLSATGAPSASIAVAVGGRAVWIRAYGLARLDPPSAAQASTRYGVGSISKQFTAAALLILQTRGQLSLDDPVSRWFPDLTAADKISVRQLLTHTAGYQDFYPEDYTPESLRRPTTPEAIMTGWARKPLDFPPGEAWQYSNTGYVIAGRIVERVSGQSLFAFLKANIFDPLGMSDVVDNDANRIRPPDATGYTRAALARVRPVAAEGTGWMFAAGELAMPASDLLKWDLSLLNRSLLTPEAYQQEISTITLKNGQNTGYALGLFVSRVGGRTVYEHSGEIAGFVSENRLYPDQKTAIVVLTNLEAGDAAALIADRVAEAVLEADPVDASVEATFLQLQQGTVDRARLAPNLDAYFNDQTVRDYRESLSLLGPLKQFQLRSTSRRGGMEFRLYRATFAGRAVAVSVYLLPNGRLEQFLVAPAN